MNPVLTAASIVTCGHPVPGVPAGIVVTGSPVLTVAGAGVLTAKSLIGATITPTSCSLETTASTTKCKEVKKVIGGSASWLTVNGDAVLAVQGLDGVTDGLPVPVPPKPGLLATPKQTFLTAGSGT